MGSGTGERTITSPMTPMSPAMTPTARRTGSR